ncbi:MAG: hypothetical protein F4Z31_10045 [Gemmatimonadetes bacterium]|nr:hypothetical protein [Gemmatimonadota bacterium]MYJ09448.1 hypothetical protein [Gemmatimonadota bacterium]
MSPDESKGSSDREAERFLDSVNRSGFWRFVDLRLCAIRSGDQWINLATRGFLDHRAGPSVPEYSPVNRPDFRAQQVVLPIRELADVVRGIASGEAELGDWTVRYTGASDRPVTDMRYGFGELGAPYHSAAYDEWSCHALVHHGASMWEVVMDAGHAPGELDGTIRGGPNPYGSFSDLIRRFCGRPGRLDIRGHSTTVELIAPVAVRFDRESAISAPDRVTLVLRAAADIFVAKAELGWTVGAAGQPSRHRSIELRDCRWVPDRESIRAEVDVRIRRGDSFMTSVVVHGERCVDFMSLPLAEAGGNIRIKAHSAVDPSLERFREQLDPARPDKSKGFEHAVGLLFFFLGFHVDPVGAQIGLRDPVDHLAHAPGTSVTLVIECTAGSIDAGGKVGRLVARSRRLAKALSDSEVIAVLATATPRDALSEAEVEKAARDGVVVLARENLRELWTAAQAGETSGQVVRRLRQLLVGAASRAKA